MTAYQDDLQLRRNIFGRTSVEVSATDCMILRRAEKTLHSWAELQCGVESGHIEQSDATGLWYWFSSNGKYSHRVPDRERGALKRIAAVCASNGLHYYHQTDPRGTALYVSDKPLTDQNYSRDGIACSV